MLVVFADHTRAHIVAPVVELFLHLVFDELAFFFDHQNFVQPHREFAQGGGFERPRHTDFHQANTDFGGVTRVDSQVFERLQGVEITFSRGDNAQARFVAIDRNAI